jgi:hypothetical protein
MQPGLLLDGAKPSWFLHAQNVGSPQPPLSASHSSMSAQPQAGSLRSAQNAGCALYRLLHR